MPEKGMHYSSKLKPIIMSTKQQIIKGTTLRKIKYIIEFDIIDQEVRFPDDVWFIIKKFAGYSSNYPMKLPYYSLMLGRPKNYCRTKMKSRKIKTFENYIDMLWEICDNLEEDMIFAFIPKQKPKSWDQIRIEWDERNGEGSFDADIY